VNDALAALASDYWDGVLRRNPILATFFGDYRFNDRLPDIGPDGRADEESVLHDVLHRLDGLSDIPLDQEDQITRDMLRLAVQAGLDSLRLRLDEMSVDQMDGPQVWLLELINFQPIDTPEHVEQFVARLNAFDGFMDQYLTVLQDGIRDGRTAPTIAVDRVQAQLDTLLGQPLDAWPMMAAGRGDAAKTQPKLADALARSVDGTVAPAYRRMADFLQTYRRDHARADPGVWSVTDGTEIYRLLAHQHTTTTLSPDQLHQIGLDDLARIHAEMRAIMAQRGAGDRSIREFTERLTSDPANLPRSREELIDISETLLAAARAALPRAFGRLPRSPIEVKPVEEYRERDAPAAFYFQPSPDGSRPAVFYINTFEPSVRPKHTLPALAFHEGVPGHHLQIAIAQETDDLPAFRRFSAGWLSNAFVEGWALYSERLADELGLYEDDLARFGMLGYQAWRACRLVVDTGLHHLHWSRRQAIDFFFDNVGLTERETVNEVDRYIVWPGQALAYKIGQREIESLRQQEQTRLGHAFDLRHFHDALLAHAAVPLSTLPLLVRDRT
jgi:uncharacterized protein (DUF885 family)